MLTRVPSPAAIAIDRPTSPGSVVVSVSHAGRIYPPEILAAARVEQSVLARLEDSWCDLIAAHATDAGATIVRALWARAVADCNRGEGQMAPAEVAPAIRPRFSAPGRKERAGLGVVPTRLADCGSLWKRPIDGAAFDWRLDALHRPFHHALAAELAAARARVGHAILIDLHSMPPIPRGQAGYGAGIVVGDRFGGTAEEGLIELIVGEAQGLGVPVTRNQPYAGGHIVRTHGKPAGAIHAAQIEIDRSLYLGADRSPDPVRLAALCNWFAGLVERVGRFRPADDALPLAAE